MIVIGRQKPRETDVTEPVVVSGSLPFYFILTCILWFFSVSMFPLAAAAAADDDDDDDGVEVGGVKQLPT